MQLRNQKLAMEDFLRERADVMRTWPTGKDVDFEDGVRYQLALPESKRFSTALAQAERERSHALAAARRRGLGRRAYQALAVPRTFMRPAAVNYRRLHTAQPLRESRRVVEALTKPVQVRHGTPDACSARSRSPPVSPPTKAAASLTTSPTPRKFRSICRSVTGNTATASSACMKNMACASTGNRRAAVGTLVPPFKVLKR